jgi:hypothetical protein
MEIPHAAGIEKDTNVTARKQAMQVFPAGCAMFGFQLSTVNCRSKIPTLSGLLTSATGSFSCSLFNFYAMGLGKQMRPDDADEFAGSSTHFSLNSSRMRLIWLRLTGIWVCFLSFILSM